MSKNIILRLANEKDIDSVLELSNIVADIHGKERGDILKTHPRHITKKRFLNYICETNRFIIVIEDSKKIVGIMLCKIKHIVDDNKFKDNFVFQIEDTCLYEEYRNKGYSDKMMNMAKEIAKANNCQRMEAAVWNFNKSSIAFFKKNSFKEQRIIYECFL
ncbi:MAG TPA: hypothetical protein DC024_08875 [Clostridiales bacterium]|jgi:ribosomal protein S18 acetylase RimI-like enzyme|nr:hypothetical protein [Clostridiales bacterium]HCS10426.1 hypothetical protein [Clostridiales bacterium]